MRRKFDFTQEIADEICSQIADGKSMRTICAANEMPSMTTVFKWLRTKDDFAQQYARAKQEQADALFEDVLNIADAAQMSDHQVARLKIDTRKWMAGKLRPKVYGDKITNEHTGEGGGPVVFETNIQK